MSIFIQSNTSEYSVIDPIQSNFDKNIIINGKINPKLRSTILKAVESISKNMNITVTKIWILGSSLTYQWTPKSDIDVTLFIKGNKDDLKDLNKHLNQEYNEKLFISEHPINFHIISGSYPRFKADAIYDLQGDNWIKKPEALNEEEIREIIDSCASAKEFNEILEEYTKLRALLNNYNGTSSEEIIKQALSVSYLFNKIKDIRREDFKKRNKSDLPSANFRCSNIIFKILESYGLDDLASQVSKVIDFGFKN